MPFWDHAARNNQKQQNQLDCYLKAWKIQRYNGFKLYISLLKRWGSWGFKFSECSPFIAHLPHYALLRNIHVFCRSFGITRRGNMFLRVASFFPSAKINLAIGFVHAKDGGFPACATLSRGLHAQFATNGISIGCAPCGDAEHCSINYILGCA